MTIAEFDTQVLPPRGSPTVDVEIVVPVYNEEAELAHAVHRLHAFLITQFPFTAVITIADNASTDSTWAIARRLEEELPFVRATHLDAKGRGRALHDTWSASTARVVAYMDVDLSTDLSALLPLVAPLMSGHSDVAIGSRLSRTSRVVRGPKREFISRCYNLILRATLGARFSDAQCGFKAMRTVCARALLPHVHDTGWFFDTELLVLAERAGLRIAEVPVDWVDDPDSRVDIVATAMADLRGVARVGRALATGALPLRDLRQQLGRHPSPSTGSRPACPGRSCGSRRSASGARSRICCCFCCFAIRWARKPPTSPRCCSPRSPIPRRIVGSPSACAGMGPPDISFRAWSSSALASR